MAESIGPHRHGEGGWAGIPHFRARSADLFRGIEGGREPPLVSLFVATKSSWLDHRSVAQASRRAVREDARAHRPEQLPPGRRGQAPRPLWPGASRKARPSGHPVAPLRWRRSLPHGRP